MDTPVDAAAEEAKQGASRLWDGFTSSLPRLGIALGIIVAGWLVARLVRAGLRARWRRTHGPSFAVVMSKLVSWILVALVTLAAITVTFPSVKPVDILSGLGFFSIAVGFAFKDVLENALSGVLLLFRQPFRTGDLVEVGGTAGIIEAITIRETRITTVDGQLVIIPNAQVYTSVIAVKTARELRRMTFVVGVGYGTDLAEAGRVITEAVAGVTEVRDDPAAAVVVCELATSTVDLEVRFWTAARGQDVTVVRGAAIAAAKEALDAHGIELPTQIIEVANT